MPRKNNTDKPKYQALEEANERAAKMITDAVGGEIHAPPVVVKLESQKMYATELLGECFENNGFSLLARIDAAEAIGELCDLQTAREEAVRFLVRIADRERKDALNAEPRERVRAARILLKYF